MKNRSHRWVSALRWVAALLGLTIGAVTVVVLWDGSARIGVGGSRMFPSSQWIQVDAPLELFLTAGALGSCAVLLVIAGAAPHLFERPPLLQVLLLWLFVCLFAIGLISA